MAGWHGMNEGVSELSKVGRRRGLAWAMSLLPLCLPVAARAAAGAPEGTDPRAPHVHCEVRYASQTVPVDAWPTARPEAVAAVDIGERFRFKAVVRGQPGAGIQHIALSVHDLVAEGAPVPLAQQRLAAPFAPTLWNAPPPALTGWQHVYASGLGRELVYGCALRGQPPQAVREGAVPGDGAAQAGTAAAIAPALPPVTAPGGVPDAEVRLAFVGDVMLADGPGRLIARGGDPFAQVAQRLAQADVRIANLECVVAQGGKALDKPWTFRARPAVLSLLKRHVDVVSVANNHSGDFGREAFAEMLDRLAAIGLPQVGGGRNLAQAHRPLLIERRGIKIALLAYDEFFPRHFEAGHDHAGVAWSEDEQVVDDIRRARREFGADLVIPFMHWGQEHEPLANARQRQLARLMVDAGADAVVGTHPHVVQDTEVYRGKPIVYSLGNFVFDGFSALDNRTGWMLFMTLGREGVRHWHTEVVRQDVDGTPWPLPSPPIRAGHGASPLTK